MRKTAFLFLILIAYSAFLDLIPPPAYAGNLTQTILRLTRQTTSTSSGGMVCTTIPSSDNGTEDQVQVIFPSSFTVNQTASNWTVDTDNISQGASSWPGIATATSVNGQMVTFPSSNLSPSTTYCFNFSRINTLTTPSAVGGYPGTIRTRSSNTTVDTIEIGIPIISNDGIAVTATAPANPTDFQATLSLNPSHNAFQQGSELNYTLRYGSSLANPTGITVEAEWDLGIAQNIGTPTEDILDYIVGSASNGYNNTPPVIDTINRKITWTISSFPANTSNQAVTFRLKTNDSYRATYPVTFAVHGRVLGPGTQTADSTVTSNYYNSNFVTPTPNPTCVPGSCPTATPVITTPTPTPIPIPRATIQSIEIRSISSSEAAIFVAANKNVKVRINYGPTPQLLNKSAVSSTFARQHIIDLKNLLPKNRYIFRVLVTDENGKITTSDLYSFDTAVVSKIPIILPNSLIVSSGDVLLSNSLNTSQELANIIIPYDMTYSFRFEVAPFEDIKSIRAVLRPDNVLGITSNQSYESTNTVQTIEINPGQYIGRLQSRDGKGNFRLVFQIQDYNGNFKEEAVAKLYIVTPMTIVNATSKTGVENVKSTIYYYNYRLRKYEILSTSLTSIKNPNKSGRDGVIDTVLPEGRYKAELSSFGYKAKTVEFIIGPNASNYPLIELTPLPFNFWSYIQYTFYNAVDIFSLLNGYIDNLKATARFLELYTFGAILLFICLSLLRLSRAYGVPIIFLPYFALYHLITLFYKPKHTYFVQGKIVDVITNIPIEGVLLHFSHTNGKIINHTRTNEDGEFAVPIRNASTVKISINKRGFTPFTKTINKDELKDRLTIVMGKVQKPSTFGWETIVWYSESLGGSLFAAFLIITLIIEILFALEFGLLKALTCIIVTIGNIFLWALHVRPKN